MLWEVGTRTAELLARTNEIAFIDATDDQMTACLDGLHLAGRLRPLRPPDGPGRIDLDPVPLNNDITPTPVPGTAVHCTKP